MSNVMIVILSFFASLGFGIVFQIRGRTLLFAALGGALTRIVLLFGISIFDQRILFVTLAAAFASLYAEILASRLHMPSTVLLYPSIVPLIPGDLLYDAAVGLLLQDHEQFVYSASNLILALLGLSIGFVLISTISYYVRRFHLRRTFRLRKKKPTPAVESPQAK